MTRKVFFSFHFERDAWRASQVRNSDVTNDKAGYVDMASWEEVKKKGDAGIKAWIRDQLVGTSVTAVLIGAETHSRSYVQYELEQSWARGNGILGIYIHKLKNALGDTDIQGNNNFGPVFTSIYDNKKYFFERFHTYDWVSDDGYHNFGSWVEVAARQAGK